MTGLGVVRALLQETSDEFAHDGELPDLVAHYTAQGTLPYLLRAGGGSTAGGLGSLWATSVRFLNDRQEFTAGWRTIREGASQIDAGVVPGRLQETVRQLLESDDANLGLPVYSVSFSGAPDELGQWRGYADDGFGVSVVVARTKIENQLGGLDDTLFGPVIYREKRQALFAWRLLARIHLNALTPDEASQALQLAAVFMKHPGFEAEREYRLVRVSTGTAYRVRESRRRLVPYLDPLEGSPPLPVEKIIVGPAWQLAGMEDVAFERHHVTLGLRMTLDLSGLQSVGVQHSSIPYDPS